jgi:hypothetical protein
MRQKILPLSFLLLVLFISGCVGKPADVGGDFEGATTKHSTYDMPITTRDFYMGVVPTPKNKPESTFDDLVNAYEEAGNIGEVAMVWVQPTGIGKFEKLKQNKAITALRNYWLKPVVTLSFATISEVPGEGLKYAIEAPAGVNADLSDPEFRQLWVSEASNIAGEFKPEYFSLGNEINDYFYLNPGHLDDYITLFDEACTAIKQASPQTKVFVVLSYTHLIENDQFDFFTKFDDCADMIGLTTYPWKHYKDPSGIPDDYYTRIEQHTSKPIAFTEIGWISSAGQGSSEQEQAEFLVRFLELTDGMDVEMINWLFLHEVELSGIVAKVTQPETSTISLKNADGSKKEIYDLWLDLHQVSYSG